MGLYLQWASNLSRVVRKQMWCSLTLAFVAAMFSACNSNAGSQPASPQVARTERAPIEAPTPRPESHMGRNAEKHVRLEANCWSGSASTARAPSVIDFRASCSAPSHGGQVSFSLGRFRLHGSPGRPGILRFTRHPKVIGPGKTTSRGECERIKGGRGGLECTSRAKGRITIIGKLWVKAASRCSSVVEMTTYYPLHPCARDKICSAGIGIRTLAKGRPRGC